jgi:chitin synthase
MKIKMVLISDFWMMKSSQSVLGSLTCCPGCFSVYRASAVAPVLQEYSSSTTDAVDVFYKDTGKQGEG